MSWETELYEKANRIADSFRSHPRVVAIALCGSVGRGQIWEHSDLELCLVVEQRIEELQHFNYIDGMGVEIIQLTRGKLEAFVNEWQGPDRSLLAFPIQIYQCKILHDPEQVLAPFMHLYDSFLFDDSIVSMKEEEMLKQADLQLDKARRLVETGCAKTAAAHLRIGLNFLLLGYYWRNRILPRSQNRTIYFLKQNSAIIGHDLLYDLFILAFCLNLPDSVLKERLLDAQPSIFPIAESSWGSQSSTFLKYAVDGSLEWGHDQSIIYVYKYCIHRMQANSYDVDSLYDQPSFVESYPELHRFLDFDDLTPDIVSQWIDLYAAARGRLDSKAIN
ncbi:hypothetical protein DVH26_22200 [Paenibacillus sp. H1-7]|uniref:nucleotidyltransferase domain-containing protein n=1 Tax=Paenibacillus sp. H1-7 TaxID=2282849 RepID=UPI001EF91A00|nr:nucleotidyltransferase domain-containing protein [Paenibacillus sp. H1-7]ULL16913.1 hypothetical protein DVH26_22200 [Paenibacillus sp. H1-7]